MALVAILFAFLSVTVASGRENDPIIFPDAILAKKSCNNCRSEVPVEMALRLSSITDENELFQLFKWSEKHFPMKAIQFRASMAGIDRLGIVQMEEHVNKSVTRVVPATCKPELRTVSLRQSEDPALIYWPSCTRVERCGGCCGHDQLSCQPIEIETVYFQVVKAEYTSELQFREKELVPVEKHVKCKCDCIIKEKDCNRHQEFINTQCRCMCKNKDAEKQCKDTSGIKEWNSDKCTCECLNVFECSTGTYFSQSTCRCQQNPDITRQIGGRYRYRGPKSLSDRRLLTSIPTYQQRSTKG